MSFFSVPVAYASVDTVIRKVNKVIINPIIIFVFTVALMYFLYGVAKFLWSESDADKNQGKQHMLWGIIGMFIMVSVFAIMQIILNTLHVEGINPREGTVEIP